MSPTLFIWFGNISPETKALALIFVYMWIGTYKLPAQEDNKVHGYFFLHLEDVQC